MKGIKIEIKWAIIFVLMMLVWMAMERVVGLHDRHIDKHVIYTNFVAIPAILIYAFALLDKRKNYYNGIMSYKQGFITGLVITLIVTLISPFTQWITTSIITPNFFPNMIAYSVEQDTMTQEAAAEYFNLRSYILQVLIGTPVMGILTSAIVAIFTRKKEKI